MTQPAPGQGEGIRDTGRDRRSKQWRLSSEDDGRFVTVIVTDATAGTTLRYRVRREPFGFQPTRSAEPEEV